MNTFHEERLEKWQTRKLMSTQSDVNIHLTKAWNAIDWLLIIRKSYQSDKIKQDFF